MSTKTWTLPSYKASCHINCLTLGQKSARILATCGINKKVNIWVVGKSGCIMTLSDHISPIQALSFNRNEDSLATGSLSGSIKIWDLGGSKEVRSFRGHKSAVTNIEFHNFGKIIATGSVDCAIKLWDVTSRACMFTYRGHKDSINCLKFSPDGMWLASGSSDNIVKLWDLTTGKLLTELRDHKAPIMSIGFHPRDLLLATSSKDHTMKLYDLNVFTMVNSINKSDSNGLFEKILFHQDNHALYAATNDSLRIFTPEPLSCMETVTVGWQNGFRDMAFTSNLNQLIGVSLDDCTVTSHVIDIKSCPPFTKVDQPKPSMSHIHGDTIKNRRTFSFNSIPTNHSFHAEHDRHQPVDDVDSKQEVIEIQDQEECDRTFKNPNRFNIQPELVNPALHKRQISPRHKDKSSRSNTPLRKENNSRSNTPNRIKYNEENKQPNDVGKKVLKAERIEMPILPSGDLLDEDVVVDKLLKRHTAIYSNLETRHSHLAHIRSGWSPNNVPNSIIDAAKLGDLAILVDLLRILEQNSHLITMDVAIVLLNHLQIIVTSKHLRYVEAACQILKIILTNYSGVIKGNISHHPIKVDINREERYQKCKKLYEGLQIILKNISTGRNGSPKSTLQIEVKVLLDSLCE